jgi:vacuolar-type H+-ATPase subunit H
MTHIDEIIQAEKEAENIRKKACEEAEKRIRDAEMHKDSLLSKYTESYPQKELAAIAQGEQEADEEGLRITKESENEIASLEKTAQKNTEKTIRHILESL